MTGVTVQVSRLARFMPDHDTHYKRLFSHPRMVVALLQGFFPQAWLEHVDATTLTQLPAAYLSELGARRHGDRVWRIPLPSDKDDDAAVHLLLEFQSRPDRHMALRMMAYVSLLQQEHARATPRSNRLPPVLAIVLYNGQPAWRMPTTLQTAYCPPSLHACQPQLRYLLLDQARLVETGQLPGGNPVSLLFRLEQCRHPADIAPLLNDLVHCTTAPSEDSLRRAFVEWLRNSLLPTRFPDLKISTITELEEFRDMLADTVKVWTRQWKREGMREGRLAGKRDATRSLLTRQLICRYGPVPAAVAQRIAQASQEDLEHWSLTLLTAPSLDGVFTRPPRPATKEKGGQGRLPPDTPAA